MDIFLIIAILLIIITMSVILFASPETGQKVYKAISAAAMAVIGTLGFKFISEGV